MTKLEQIKNILFEKEPQKEAEIIKFEIVTLDDGVSKVEANKFEAGEKIAIVNEDNRTALPVGNYGMEDGREIVVAEEGIIEQIREKQSEEVKEEEMAEEVAASDSVNETPVAKKVVDSVVKETYFSKEEMDAKDLKIQELEAQILELSKVENKGITHNPEPKEQKNVVIAKDADNSKMNTIFNFINK